MTTVQRFNRHSSRIVVVATAIITLAALTPAQSASAHPKEQQQRSASVQNHWPTDGAQRLRELTVHYRELGLSGQASRVAAQLTLGR